MNQIDFALLIIILACFAFGWKLRGVYMIIVPVAFFIGIFFANITYDAFSNMLAAGVPNEAKRRMIAYCISFIISAGVVIFIGMFLARGFDFFKLTFLDRALGAAILISVMLTPIYFLFIFLDNKLHFNLMDFHLALKHSLFFPRIQKYVEFLSCLPMLRQLAMLEAILK
jgi:uncharacterized membrane protein required for colicin V production